MSPLTPMPPPSLPVDPELFARTAPAYNCVDFPGDGPHYLDGAGGCWWCGQAVTR